MASVDQNLKEFKETLTNEINLTLKKAFLYAAILGIGCGILITVFDYVGLVTQMGVPALWASFCGFYALFVFLLARKKLVKGPVKYVVIFPFISLPTLIFVLSAFLLPSGVSTYIFGPPVLLYFFAIIFSGFLFDMKVSIFAGIITGLEYFIVYYYSQPVLQEVYAPNTLMQQDISSGEIHFFKSLMMVFTGFVVGVISQNSKKLITKVLTEEKEKESIDKLFGQFVSNEVKNKIINEKKDIIGERKQVVVLFSDIRSFSTYSEGKDPEMIVKQLNEYFDKMVNAIMSNGGVIDKFIGDAIMAVFGGLLEMENPCESAVNAALAMRVELKTLNETWLKEGLPTFDNGIGLHYGEVLEGTIGSKDRKEFTVIGDTVNTASRLESVTKDYSESIIISDAVFEKLSEKMKERALSLGETMVKGKKNAVQIYGYKDVA